VKINVKVLAFVAAVTWGILAMLLTGSANLIWPTYGREFLQVMASVYPGYHAARSFGQVLIGTLYGLADGAVCGIVFGWPYNLLAGAKATRLLLRPR
jgi:hypothetical protein